MGLARIEEPDPGQAELTQNGAIMGTVDYMSPEQSFDAKTVDRRADLYSLGCTLHYLLTGNPPYAGSTQFAKFLGHKEGTIPDLTQLRKDVPPQLNFVFQKLLCKLPGDRYQTAAELIVDLESIQPLIASFENSMGTDIPIAPSSFTESDSSIGNPSQFAPSFSQTPTQDPIAQMPAPLSTSPQAPYQPPPASSSPPNSSRKIRGKRTRKQLTTKAIAIRGGVLLAMLISHFLLFHYIKDFLIEPEVSQGTLTVEIASDKFESQLVGKQIKIRNITTQKEFFITLNQRKSKRPMQDGTYELVFEADSKFLVPNKQFTIKPGVDLKLSLDWQPSKKAPVSNSNVASSQNPRTPVNPTSRYPDPSSQDVSERFGQSSLYSYGPKTTKMAFYPTVTADDSQLIFLGSSTGSPTQIDTIYASSFENSQWQNPKSISLGAEDGFPVELSADGLKVIVSRLSNESQHQLIQASRSSIKFSWPSKSFLRNNPSLINSSLEQRDPHLSENGLTLIFSAEGEGSHGKYDLWMCDRFSVNGSWGTPVNLGTKINTGYTEFSPSVSPNGLILCFGRRDFGTGDPLDSELWISTRDSVSSTWKTPNRHVIGGRDSQLGGFEFIEGGSALAFHAKPDAGSLFRLLKIRLSATTSAGAKMIASSPVKTTTSAGTPVLVSSTEPEPDPSWGISKISGTKVVKTRQFPELSTSTTGAYSPSLSPDGLAICWTQVDGAFGNSEIMGARRSSISASFGESKQIENHVQYGTFSPKGLLFIAVTQEGGTKDLLVSSSRKSIAYPLSGYTPITRFSRTIGAEHSVFNASGTKLVFQRSVSGDASRSEFVFATREIETNTLTAPEIIPLGDDPLIRDQKLTWPSLADRDLTLWFCIGEGADSRIVRATRDSTSDAFSGYRYLMKDGERVRGCSPRFVNSTGELFYAIPSKIERLGLWELVASKLEESTEPDPVFSEIADNNNSDPAMEDTTASTVEGSTPIEILPLIDLEAHPLSGVWSQSNSGLQCNFNGINAIELPVTHDSSYALEFDCELKNSSVGIATRLLADDRVFSILLTSQYCKVETQKNNQIFAMSRKTLPELTDIFKNKSNHRVRYEVNTRNVKVVIDDQVVLDWKGDFKSLGKTSDTWMMGSQKIALKTLASPALSFSTAENKLTRLTLIDLKQAKVTLATKNSPTKKPTVKSDDPPLLTQNTINMKMKYIPAGKAMLGQSTSKFEITLTQPFYMGIYEVTQAEYFQVMGTNPSRNVEPTNPVETVSWQNAMEFCQRLSSHPKEIAAGRVYRLPTEAEWEYACRAGTSTQYSLGNNTGKLSDYAWYSTNAGGTTHPVGEKLSNAWGLFDMHGNVREWCFNNWVPAQPQSDPQKSGPTSVRAHRGGAYISSSTYLSSGYRTIASITSMSSSSGFRIVMFQRKK